MPHVFHVAGHATEITLPRTDAIRPGAIVRWLSPASGRYNWEGIKLPTSCEEAIPLSYTIGDDLRVSFPASERSRRGWQLCVQGGGQDWSIEPDVVVDVGGMAWSVGDHSFPSVGRAFRLNLEGTVFPGDRVRFVLASAQGGANCSDVAPGSEELSATTRAPYIWSGAFESATFVFESPPGSPEVTPLFMCYATKGSEFVPQYGGSPALFLFQAYPPTRAVLDKHYPGTPDSVSVRRVGSLPPRDWTIWKELAEQAGIAKTEL